MTSMETRRSDHLAGDDIMTTVTGLSRRSLQRNSSTCSLVVRHSTVSGSADRAVLTSEKF